MGVCVCILFMLLLLKGCQSSKKEEQRYTATFLDVFDTKTEILGYGTSEEEFMTQVEILKEKLMHYHRLFDIYHEYEGINNIKTINDKAGIEPVSVDDEIIELIRFCMEMYEQSKGQVDISMGSVLSIWHDYREYGIDHPEDARIPSMNVLKRAAKHRNLYQIILNEEAGTVYLADPLMSLDVGGIGKGYAVQKVVRYAKEIGIENLLLSVGGNVAAVGSKKDGTPWKIGIQNPDMESDEVYVQKVNINDACVVTSGNYQRYYTVDGKEYCHIIDPDTLMPAEYAASVTIITRDSGVADAMSTAVYNMPVEEGLEFVNGMDGLEAMWVLEDGSILYSEHFEDYVTA